MNKEEISRTFRISYSLKNTYRVNTILYSLKQIPLIKKLLPAKIYGVKELKIFANILSAMWEVASVFIWKLLYFVTLVCGVGAIYSRLPSDEVFLHVFLMLTIIGFILNTHLFNPTRDKYYAIILLRMDAKGYTLTDYFYRLLKDIIGFLPMTLIFGLLNKVPLWICFIIPFSVVAGKIFCSAISLANYEKRGKAYNENKLSIPVWIAVLLLLVITYGMPAMGYVIPEKAVITLLIAFIPLGLLGIRKIITFGEYRQVNQEILAQMLLQLDSAKNINKKSAEKMISKDRKISSAKKGFEYLNELFMKRHRKILWQSTRIQAIVILILVIIAVIFVKISSGISEETYGLMIQNMPYFVFIMYAINRGMGFTKALFMNCDHSLLTYSFFKQPNCILRLFAIRLREIIKVNLLPATVLGAGLSVIFYMIGGSGKLFECILVFLSVISLSVFFSVHYLTIYYLLQPYNPSTEVKSGTYFIIQFITYVVSFIMIYIKLPVFIFGILCVAFCVIYCVVACILVYRFAPKTFRLRN